MAVEITVTQLDFELGSAPISEVFEKSSIRIGFDDSYDLVLDGKNRFEGGLTLKIIAESPASSPLLLSEITFKHGVMVENELLPPGQEKEIRLGQSIILATYLLEINLSGKRKPSGRPGLFNRLVGLISRRE